MARAFRTLAEERELWIKPRSEGGSRHVGVSLSYLEAFFRTIFSIPGLVATMALETVMRDILSPASKKFSCDRWAMSGMIDVLDT